ncbi:Protein-glutamate methylesterase/protein-glutamine glutaminase [Paenibacillus allorhizoplanae]|uniref:Protein-glutamate methylesterase/protein-glutamine glutaminase n=1 Tax=Paenibacillus allorhizoplanae TaxID=2905648 RepID=A0ABM9C4H8_9BACL|nr:Protein-glutamate methylesterase/protein-glutamine glutaminase [Paenibacillus allorhizoplanae]
MVWKIAIIDDERQVLQGMKRAIPWDELEAEWVGEAMNGVDGLNMIRTTQPDIVITDIYMPLMNGLDMIEQLRKEEFPGKIIILSGYSDFEHARQALRYNVSDYVSKPISMPTLKVILNKIIQELMDVEERRMKQGELEYKLMLYEPFIEKEWVRSAVVGTLESANQTEQILPQPYRFWSNTNHAVIGIELVRDERVRKFSVSDWNLYRFAVSNIVYELARKVFPSVEYTELHSTRAVLIIHPESDNNEYTHTAMKDLSIQIIESVASYLKLMSRVGSGSIKSDWTQIPDSTEEAFRAIDMRQLRVIPPFEFYVYQREAATEEEQVALFPVKFSYELANAMKAVQKTKAQQLVADYIGELESQAGIRSEYVQMLGSELWGIISYCLYEAGHVLDDLFTNDQIAKEIKDLIQPDQLQKWLSEKISIICDSRQWKGSSKHRQVVDFITHYIHEHYAEDLTLAILSDKVFISRNHLSIIFKNMTGETFNTYLTRVRIEKARELLLERNMLVYEVAESVGYKNFPYFSLLFKKMTGMNPTDLIKL